MKERERERGSFEAVKGGRGIQVALSLKSAARHDTPRETAQFRKARLNPGAE